METCKKFKVKCRQAIAAQNMHAAHLIVIQYTGESLKNICKCVRKK